MVDLLNHITQIPLYNTYTGFDSKKQITQSHNNHIKVIYVIELNFII
jgi:hypothetical protein